MLFFFSSFLIFFLVFFYQFISFDSSIPCLFFRCFGTQIANLLLLYSFTLLKRWIGSEKELFQIRLSVQYVGYFVNHPSICTHIFQRKLFTQDIFQVRLFYWYVKSILVSSSLPIQFLQNDQCIKTTIFGSAVFFFLFIYNINDLFFCV